MPVAILGERGSLGRLVVEQARSRGIDVRAHGLHSYDDEQDLLTSFTGCDAVVLVFPADLKDPYGYPDQLRRVFALARAAGVPRVIGLIGSAGALTAHGERLVDTDFFQETTRHFYQSVHAAWEVYREAEGIDWVAFVPAARMQGHLADRGGYRTRTDERLVTTDDTSRHYFDVSQISYGDCARAILDEIETPAHSGQFVTLGW